MKTLTIIVICLAVSRGACGESSPQNGQKIHFRTIRNSIIAVPVSLNGRGPFDFVLDTGTDTSIIDTELANQLGLKYIDEATLFTAAGRHSFSRAFIQTVAVGGTVGRDVEVLATEVNPIFRDRKVRGVLGENFLIHFDILLDYKNGVVDLRSPCNPEPIKGVRIPISFEHGRPALLWKTSNGSDLRLLLDSGTSALTFFKADVSNFRPCIVQACNASMETIVSSSAVYPGIVPSFHIGDASLHDVPAFYSAQKPDGDNLDGMLPTGIFRFVYINNHEGFAVFGPGAP
jgi:predicted aspartyl protease